MKTTDKKTLLVRAFSAVLLLIACFCMYDFYKCLSGFIANGFREPLVMLPMILAYFLPVLCFLFFFYDLYVRAIRPAAKAAYSVLVAIYAIADLALIFNRIGLYTSNNALGVYDALPGFILRFPYDMTVILFVILIIQILNLSVLDRKGTRAGEFVNGLKQRGTLHIGIVEYIVLSIFAVVIFVFTGSALCASLAAFENALYDWKYVFLLLWVMIVPMMNLALVVLKPEKMELKKHTKSAILGAGIGINLLFGLLFLIFELTHPDLLVHIGKPLFLIAFSVSLPIEPAIIIGIMVLGTVILAVRLIKSLSLCKKR